MPMQLKLDDAGHVVVQDGKPVYVHEDGKEVPFDAAATIKAINDRGAENKAHREAKEQALAKLQAYEGIDPEEARKAFDLVRNLEDKKLIEAGEVERVKKAAADAFEERLKAVEKKYKPVIEERDAYRAQLHNERLTTAFARSKYIAENLAIPVDMAQARFGSHFTVDDDGNILARGYDGQVIDSLENPGSPAGFDEALRSLVGRYQHRDHILKGTGASGSGAGGTRMGADGKRTVSRAAFDRMDPADRMKTAIAAGNGEVTLVD
jgi:hypothetical protein